MHAHGAMARNPIFGCPEARTIHGGREMKISTIKPGDFLNASGIQEIFPWLEIKTIYGWAKKYKEEPENYPPCAKIGQATVWPRAELISFVNRKFAEYLQAS